MKWPASFLTGPFSLPFRRQALLDMDQMFFEGPAAGPKARSSIAVPIWLANRLSGSRSSARVPKPSLRIARATLSLLVRRRRELVGGSDRAKTYDVAGVLDHAIVPVNRCPSYRFIAQLVGVFNRPAL
jgi:hypothetical protein